MFTAGRATSVSVITKKASLLMSLPFGFITAYMGLKHSCLLFVFFVVVYYFEVGVFYVIAFASTTLCLLSV